jgi:phytoene synthase
VYLPQDELARFGVTADDLLHARYGESFSRLMAFQVERARDCTARHSPNFPPPIARRSAPG